jgi:hypothetical protein
MKKYILTGTAIIIALSVFTGCASSETQTEQTNQLQVEEVGKPEQNADMMQDKQRESRAVITAINENAITVKFATEPQGEPESGEPKNEIPEMNFDGEEIQIEATGEMLKTMKMPEDNGERELPDSKPDDKEKKDEKPDNNPPEIGNIDNMLEESNISEFSEGDEVNVIYEDDGTTVKYIVKTEKNKISE